MTVCVCSACACEYALVCVLGFTDGINHQLIKTKRLIKDYTNYFNTMSKQHTPSNYRSRYCPNPYIYNMSSVLSKYTSLAKTIVKQKQHWTLVKPITNQLIINQLQVINNDE